MNKIRNYKNKLISISLLLNFIFVVCTTKAQILDNIRISPLKQYAMHSMGIARGNYSGITHIAADTFAVISDKPAIDENVLKILKITQSQTNGEITDIVDITPNSLLSYKSLNMNDCEDIIYNAHSNTLFICSESNQEIKEYTLQAKPTGRHLKIPKIFEKENIIPNKGFEAIGYDSNNNKYWIITEANLKSDINKQTKQMLLRLQSFDSTLNPNQQYTYITEIPYAKGLYREYAFGIPAIMSLNNGTLLVLEREFIIKKNYIGSVSKNKIFVVTPQKGNKTLDKTEIYSFTTSLNIGKMNLANYEGMCLGRKLNDGRQTILLISDSQNGAGNILYRLKDYIKVLIIDEKHDIILDNVKQIK